MEEKWRKQEHEEHLRRIRGAKSEFNQHTMIKPFIVNEKSRQQKRLADTSSKNMELLRCRAAH